MPKEESTIESSDTSSQPENNHISQSLGPADFHNRVSSQTEDFRENWDDDEDMAEYARGHQSMGSIVGDEEYQVSQSQYTKAKAPDTKNR